MRTSVVLHRLTNMLSRNIIRKAKYINLSAGSKYRALSVASVGSQQQSAGKSTFPFVGVVAVGLAVALSSGYTYADASAKEKPRAWKAYSRKEVESHNTLEKGVWVTYKDGVYDITQFIANHPGGQEKLMSVAGKDIASSWNIYQHHKTSALVKELAEEMKIGVLKPSDVIISEDLPNVPKFSNKPVYDCIIVGAGLSGLQTGYTLVNQHKVNQHNILVLEAQEYVGGRVKQIHEFIKGSKIEVGAEFLHGGGTELTKFAEEHDEPLREIYCWAHGDGGPLDDPADGGYGLYYIGKEKNQDTSKPDATGFVPLSYDKPYSDSTRDVKLNSKDRLLRMDDKDPDFVELNKALWELSHLNENDYDENLSLYDFLLTKKLNANMLKMGNAGFANTLCTNSRQLSLKQSIKWSRIWHSDELPEEEDGDYTFVNSYSNLVDHLKKDLQIDVNIPIDNVKYPTAENANKTDGSELIVVTTKNGTQYRAKTVVVTASPHVVQSKLITFTPELPKEVWDAFNCVKMHNVTKVFLKFKRPVWPKNLHGMIMVDDDFLLPEVWFREVSSEVAPGEQATAYAVGFTTAKYAERLTHMSQEEVFKKSLAQLEKVFSMLEPRHMNGDLKEKNIETPESLPKASEAYLGGMYWDWRPQHHPYIGGGYCSPLAGKAINYGDVLSKPCGPKMFFAGESTNARPCATAHAALETGLRAADHVASALKK